jgi:hypothetical protein
MAKGALTNEAGAQHYAKAADYVKLADAVRRTDHSNSMTSGAKCDHRKAFSYGRMVEPIYRAWS